MPKRTAKAAKQPQFAIEMEDFGPITRGKITLKPLTIFIGPNNSGKSYAAMLIDAVMKCRTDTRVIMRGGRKYRLIDTIGWAEVVEQAGPLGTELTDFISEIPEGETRQLPPKLCNDTLFQRLKDVYEQWLGAYLERSFACELGELVRFESSESFRIGLNGIVFENGPAPTDGGPASVGITKTPQLNQEIVVKNARVVGALFGAGKADARIDLLPVEDLPDALLNELVRELECHYVPAARSGMMLGGKLLVAQIVRNATVTGSSGKGVPKFPRVVSDFLSLLISPPEQMGPLYAFGNEFEKELIHGEIVVRGAGEVPYPDFLYRFHNTDIALNRASSSVSELAPLFLYLKYVVRPGSVLIIEEPETHLHPENQRILAKHLVRLVRAGVIVLITTHSEYLVEQFSNFIMLGKVGKRRRKGRYPYDEDVYLNTDEIGTYLFKFDEESSGYVIEDVEVTEEDGISQDEFVKIHESLYEETFKLRRDLEPKA